MSLLGQSGKKKSFRRKKFALFFSRPLFTNDKPDFVFELEESGKQITESRGKIEAKLSLKIKRSRPVGQAILTRRVFSILEGFLW